MGMRTVSLVASDPQNEYKGQDHTLHKNGYCYRINYFFFSHSDHEQSPSYERKKTQNVGTFRVIDIV